MTLIQLRQDLTSKCSSFYFTKTLSKHEKVVYDRRSFNDLFNYYRPKGVSELKLMRALILEGFHAQICGIEHRNVRVMFAKVSAGPIGIWATPISIGYGKNIETNDKYTYLYIQKLFEKAVKLNKNEKIIY